MSQELKQKAAKALSKSLGHKVSADDVLAVREEPSGNLIAVTGAGHKARITPDEVQLLAGPGSEPETFEPPEPPVQPTEPQGDLPPLAESPAPPEAEAQAAAEPSAEGAEPDFFEVFKGKDGQFYFHRKNGGNGQIEHPSEGYKRLKDANAAAEDLADGLEVRKI